MYTSAIKHRLAIVFTGVLSACLLAFSPFIPYGNATALSGDSELHQLQDKARSGVQLSNAELQILADPYRIPEFANLSDSEKALIAKHNSDFSQPITISFDPSTGMAVSVKETSASAELQSVTIHNPCRTGDTCLLTTKVPYAIFGLSGVGVATSPYWQYRSSIYAGNHWVSDICWIGESCVTGALAPGASFNWGGRLVTMTSIRLLS